MKREYVIPTIQIISVNAAPLMEDFQSGFNVDGDHGGDVIDKPGTGGEDPELPWGGND